MLVADFTKVNPENLLGSLSTVALWIERKQIAPSNRVGVCRPMQHEFLMPIFSEGTINVLDSLDETNYANYAPAAASIAIASYLEHIEAADNEIWLVSYSGPVLILSETFASRLTVHSISFSDLREVVRSGSLTFPIHRSRKPETLPDATMDEAIEAIRKLIALGKFDDRVHQSRVRELLSIIDSSFETPVPGQITQIVEAAVALSLLFRTGSSQATYLIRADRPLSALSSESDDLLPEIKASASQSGATQHRHGEPNQAEIVSMLSKQGYGPFHRIRQILLGIIASEANRTQETGIRYTSLVSHAVQKVRESDDWRSDDSKLSNELPWRTVSTFLYNLLAEAEVLLNKDGQPLKLVPGYGFGPDGIPLVYGIHDDWALRCTAVIIQKCLSLPLDFSTQDFEVIFETLYSKESNQIAARTEFDDALEFLRASGKITVDLDCKVIFPSPSEPKRRPVEANATLQHLPELEMNHAIVEAVAGAPI